MKEQQGRTILHNVFVYGTLKDKSVRNAVIGREPEIRLAVLDGYELHQTDSYPTILKNDKNYVEGMLLQGITDLELGRLDYYEGYPRFYRREKVQVQVDGSATDAWVYIMNEEYLP